MAETSLKRSLAAELSQEEPSGSEAHEAQPRVVYVQAPVLLGTLVEETDEGWRVSFGGAEREVPVDTSVDPTLLRECSKRGTRVLIDQTDNPLIVGVVATQRSLVIDEQDRIESEVETIKLTARRELLLKTTGTYLRAKSRELEVYGDKVRARGRNLFKVLAAMIELN